MDRRFVMVLAMSVMLALVVAIVFYKVSSASGTKPKSELKEVVVAAEMLPLGVSVKPNHVKVVKLPVEMTPKNGFSKVDDVLERSVISNIMQDEPLVEA